MTQHQVLEGCLSQMKMLERVKYFPRQLLNADDMKADQDYFRNKLRRHNRYLHGWGSVCGLEIVSAATEELPWRVIISEGYALGPCGNEIYFPEAVFLDLASCGPGAMTDPCDPGFLRMPGSATGEQVFVAIKYAECLAKPVRTMPTGCGCEEDACEYSRIRDSFQIECLTELPPSHEPLPGPMLCELVEGKQLPACPPCPTDPWVVLAQITLPASPSANITNTNIDNFTFRRQVFSTAVLQEQLIKCCCKPPRPKPAKVIRIDPPDGAEFRNDRPSSITIEFDKFIRSNTLSAISVTVTEGSVTKEVSGDIPELGIADGKTKSVTFKPSEAFSESVRGSVFKITVPGDGADAIVDVDGLVLDGNKDGSPGGNFVSQFTTFKIIQ